MFEAVDFIAELTQHIPPKYKHFIRYYGLYSSRGKATARKNEKLAHLFPECFIKENEISKDKEVSTANPENYEESVGKKRQRSAWARLIQKVFEACPERSRRISPMICSHCGSEMKITSFIFDADSLERIVDWMEKKKAKPPPDRVSVG